jgi:hypothetical protein
LYHDLHLEGLIRTYCNTLATSGTYQPCPETFYSISRRRVVIRIPFNGIKTFKNFRILAEAWHHRLTREEIHIHGLPWRDPRDDPGYNV